MRLDVNKGGVMYIDKNNCGRFTIVYDEKISSYAYAAAQLNEYLEKSCGFTLSENSCGEHKIVLGQGEAVGFSGDPALKSDGFKLIFKDGDLYVVGNSETAIIFGVYELIERFLGVKWINRDCTVIPEKSAFDAPETEVVCAPRFDQRVYLSGLAYEPEIASHLRFNFPEPKLYAYHKVKKLWCDKIPDPHNSWCYINKDEYEKEHPEFFCKSVMNATEFCYSNGITDDFEIDESKEISVLSLVTDKTYSLVRENPDSKFFMYGRQDDSTAICHCKTCERRRKQVGGEGGIMVAFLNAVIKGVEKRLAKDKIVSDFCIATLAYQMTVNPPVKDGNPLHKNVIPSPRLHIRYAPIGADYTYSFLDERQNEDVRSQIFGWAALTPNIMLWDYQCNYHEYCWYFPNLCYLKENLELYAKIGTSYLLNQGAYNVKTDWQGEMKSYVCSRLYWNTSLDVNELVKEYVGYYYSVAAPKVLRFIESMESFFREKIKNGFRITLFQGDAQYFAASSYPVGFLTEQLNLLDSAIKDIDDARISDEEKEVLKIRLYKVIMTPLRMIMRNADIYFPDEETDYGKRFFSLANITGLNKLGETLPIFIQMQKDGTSDYKIVLGQEYTASEKEAARYFQKKFSQLGGCVLQIVQDDKVYPHYGEKAVCIGDHMMFREFFKGSVRSADYEYFVETRGKCSFICGTGDLKYAADILLGNMITEVGDNGVDIKLPFMKKTKFNEKR